MLLRKPKRTWYGCALWRYMCAERFFHAPVGVRRAFCSAYMASRVGRECGPSPRKPCTQCSLLGSVNQIAKVVCRGEEQEAASGAPWRHAGVRAREDPLGLVAGVTFRRSPSSTCLSSSLAAPTTCGLSPDFGCTGRLGLWRDARGHLWRYQSVCAQEPVEAHAALVVVAWCAAVMPSLAWCPSASLWRSRVSPFARVWQP